MKPDIEAWLPKFVLRLSSGSFCPRHFTVTMLGAIESLMSAVVSDRMSNDKDNPSVELIGQGIANIVSSLFDGLLPALSHRGQRG